MKKRNGKEKGINIEHKCLFNYDLNKNIQYILLLSIIIKRKEKIII